LHPLFSLLIKKKKIDYVEPNQKTTTNGLNQQNGVGEHERIFGYTTGGLEKGKMPLWCDWEKIMVNYIPCKKY
jgi:hypothetical protein